jgi:hypothetical protein
MDFHSRKIPAYKSGNVTQTTAYAQPAASSGLSGLIGSLFGRATPVYKTVDGHGAQVPVSSGFFSMFTTVPSYKTAHSVPVQMMPLEVPLEGDAVADAGAPGSDDECAPCVLIADEIVLL